MSIKELSAKLKNRELKAVDLAAATFAKIEATDTALHSFLSLRKEAALQQARDIDAKLDKGETLSPLAGIPIAIKDNMNLRGEKTTCASKILENFVSPFTSTAVQNLMDAGMVIVGKANLDEFAMGSSTENSAFGPSKNPWNLDYVPGGSSGGSASAVASGQVPVSLGSDTGGSIRQPAAFCGISGLKPSYGRVSRYGLVAFASSLDQIGPFGRSVEDIAYVTEGLCSHDVRDATSIQAPAPHLVSALTKDVKGLRIALPKELFSKECDDAVKGPVYAALDLLKANGAIVEEVSMQALVASIATYYVIAPAEASANLARYDGVRYTSRVENPANLTEMFTKTRGQFFGKEVKRRIILGTYALSSGYYDAYYIKAQKARTLIKQSFDQVFANFDIVVSPTTPSSAFKFGEHASAPNKMYIADLCTIPANMAGLPALSIPCGFDKGMPVGMQIIGKSFDEATVLRVGDAYQALSDFHKQRPGAYA
jgi:aspartyl-tRNA(Asn)/glutamyl-tRNA(Gln) amidotransferase subunit A